MALLIMANHDPNPKAGQSSALEYPEQTRGAKLARETRQEANSLTEAQREELFRKGMQMIYGEP
jgi:hypothetical protein